ncbi:pyrroline-5-carboxylate reductase [Micrococcus sp. NPDC078436]|uniref:pyrroline-5-carboxylate reductase n=1 Tax=unclassified Micrococcus TaxID=2620948 RepID=UPI0029A358D0|nr:pyrroline-5-carboxylate reductase [Micrococcus sp. M4NT]MDX2340132.1 pyrroline-5-carboxylate reductase [Micrococcus sp. M4NT]
MKLTILGLGTMTGAILTGALDSGAVQAADVTATTRSEDSAAAARERFAGVDVRAAGGADEANADAVREADVVLLGMKPKDLVAAARGIADALPADAVVVSVAAGVTAGTIAGALRPGQPLVRTMPNTPLTVGSGVVGVAPAEGVGEEQAAAVEGLFSGSGLVVRVDERQLPAVVAAAGSAPAYVFLLAEAIAQHAVELGLDRADAEAMAAATVKGAGLMLERAVESGEQTAEDLRRAVMSPNGTTERAVTALQDGGLPQLVARAMHAAAERDREMGREFAG